MTTDFTNPATRSVAVQSSGHGVSFSRPTVVVGYAADAASEAVVAYASAEARMRGAALQVVHHLVGREVPDRYESSREADEMVQRSAARIAQDVRRMAGAVDHLSVAVSSDPLIDDLIARSRTAELIVLGATWSRRADAILFDSVARALLHRSLCPVLLVPTGAKSHLVGSVVCGVDRSEASAAALRWASEEAARRGVAVLAEEVREFHPFRREKSAQSLSAWVRTQEVPRSGEIVRRVVKRRSAAGELLAAAERRNAVLVVGMHRQDGRRLHRCVVGRLASQDRVPVVFVPAERSLPRQWARAEDT